MGGKKSGGGESSTGAMQSGFQWGTQNNTLGNTTTTNPYVTSTTNNGGTTTTLAPNTAYSSIYNFTNANMDKLLNDYLNPSVDSAQNQALLQAYTKNLNNQTRTALENNVINPLQQRGMIRSSQATDLYNQLARQQNDSISDYTAQLIGNSQNNTANVINNLMNLVGQGYNVISGNQAQSLQTSGSNGTTNSQGYNMGSSLNKTTQS